MDTTLDLDIDTQRLRVVAGSEVLDRTLAAIIVALVVAAERGVASCSASDIASLLGDAIKPDTVYERIWRAQELEEPGHQLIVASPRGRITGRYSARPGIALSSQEGALRWLAKFRAECRNHRGAPTGTRVQRLVGEVDRLEELVTAGRFADAERLLRASSLRTRVGQGISGRSRHAVRARLDRLHGGLLMQQGNYGKAGRLLQRAAEEAARAGEWKDRWYALGNLTAALRMEGVDGIRRAKTASDEILDELTLHGGAIAVQDRAELLRWLHASRASPLLVMEELDDVDYWTLRSLDDLRDVAEEQRPYAEAETRLRRVRMFLCRGDLERASDEFVAANSTLTGVAPLLWLEGWLPRYEADILASAGQFSDALARLLDAWRLCDGFGFQRIHIAQRLLELSWPGPESSTAEGRRMIFEATSLHHQYRGCMPKACRRCRGGGTLATLRCVLTSGWPSVPNQFFH